MTGFFDCLTEEYEGVSQSQWNAEESREDAGQAQDSLGSVYEHAKGPWCEEGNDQAWRQVDEAPIEDKLLDLALLVHNLRNIAH